MTFYPIRTSWMISYIWYGSSQVAKNFPRVVFTLCPKSFHRTQSATLKFLCLTDWLYDRWTILFCYSICIEAFFIFSSANKKSYFMRKLFSSYVIPNQMMDSCIFKWITSFVLYTRENGISPTAISRVILIVQRILGNSSTYFPLAPSKCFCNILMTLLDDWLVVFKVWMW